MRLGIYGGTFDPVHLGHLILAESCLHACQLDEIWFMPAAISPFKQDSRPTPGKQRLEMLKFAIAGHPRFRLSTLELDRTGPSYTVDTLRQLRRNHPDDELFLLMGADAVQELPDWKEPREILQLAEIIACSRGAAPPDLSRVQAALGVDALARIHPVTIPSIGIAAADIRERAATGRSFRFLTPRPVELYILQHKLYQPVAEGQGT
jgi:nicotinate-nucleotide adenylyltransferase